MPQVIEVPGLGPVEFPDGMSDKDMSAAIQRSLDPRQSASMGDLVAGHPMTRFAMGAASPVIGAAQLGAHIGDLANTAMGVEPVVSPWIDKQIARYDAAKQRGMKVSGSEGFDVMGLLGNLAPSAGIAKAVSTQVPQLAQKASVEGLKGVLPRMGLGAVQGGAIGATQPTTGTEEGFWSPKTAQTAISTALGGVVPLAIDAGKGVWNAGAQAVKPFTERGRAEILKDLQELLMANNPNLKARITKAAAQAKPGVGGIMPTLGQVVSDIPESTGLAAHQQHISRIKGVSPDFVKRGDLQEEARAGALHAIGGSPEALAKAEATRASRAASLYGQAEKEIVTPDGAFAELMKRPSMQSVFQRAQQIAKEKGDSFQIGSNTPAQTVTSPIVSASGQPIQHEIAGTTASYPVKSLHYMKMAMDDLIKDPAQYGIGATEAKAMTETQREFVKWLGGSAPDFTGKSPLYGVAREVYRIDSEPVNKMKVGQYLEGALRNPLDTGERASVFAKAVEEAPRTIKKATGQSIFDSLDEVLSPKDVRSVQAVAKELAADDAFKKLAGKTALEGSDAIPGRIGATVPNVLSRPAMITNFILKHVATKAEEKIAKEAAAQYLDPHRFARSMEDVPARYKPLLDALLKQAAPAASTAIARQF